MDQSTWNHLIIFFSSYEEKYGGLTDLYISWWKSPMQQNACWVFETVRIISIIISLICFTEKVYGSSPYSPNTVYFCIDIPFSFNFSIVFISSLVLVYVMDWPVSWPIEMKKKSIITRSCRYRRTGKIKRIIHSNGSNWYLSNPG